MTEEGLTPQQKKQRTTDRVEAKLKAMREAMENRRKDPFYGLPKSVEEFAQWQGEGVGDLAAMSRQTIESRPDLKTEVREILDNRKAKTPEAKVADKDKTISELKQQIKGLASENHELNLKVEALNRDLVGHRNKLRSFEKKGDGNVTGISNKQ